MNQPVLSPKTRQRAPSKRALETRARILDASETLFAKNGFDGTSLRDIAALAKVQVGLVHHHGGGKDALFMKTVARRAAQLSDARLAALSAVKSRPRVTLRDVLGAFLEPYLRLAQSGEHWLSYARLVAHVSIDPRWCNICAECFDPTADQFLNEIAALLPDAPRPVLASGFVYSVSAMLAHLTTQWRVQTLGQTAPPIEDQLDLLVAFCTAGMTGTAQQAQNAVQKEIW